MIDRSKIIDALVACKVGPVSKEAASPLVEGWLDRFDSWEDSGWKTIGVETPWFIPLEDKTIIVGQCDRTSLDLQDRLTFSEWKTRRASKIKKDGSPYLGDSEQDWLEEISQGVQLSVYGLAGREGYFIQPDGTHVKHACAEPRVLVRAALKSNPPIYWPTRINDGIFSFPQPVLDATRNALLVKAATIRAARLTKLVPHQLRGTQCRTYGRICGYYDMCTAQRYPLAANVGWHPTDPGFAVPKMLGLDPTDPELVVLSQSSYVLASTCMEKFRVQYGGHGQQEESFELETGTAFHAAMAALYEGMMR